MTSFFEIKPQDIRYGETVTVLNYDNSSNIVESAEEFLVKSDNFAKLLLAHKSKNTAVMLKEIDISDMRGLGLKAFKVSNPNHLVARAITEDGVYTILNITSIDYGSHVKIYQSNFGYYNDMEKIAEFRVSSIFDLELQLDKFHIKFK